MDDVAEVFKDHTFNLSCSIGRQYHGGYFHLDFTGSNTTVRRTQTAVNHFATFLFPAATYALQGNFSCVYEVLIYIHVLTSAESDIISVTVAGNGVLKPQSVKCSTLSTGLLLLFFKSVGLKDASPCGRILAKVKFYHDILTSSM